jgi:hypothetical protein
MTRDRDLATVQREAAEAVAPFFRTLLVPEGCALYRPKDLQRASFQA